jgi:Cu-Zn family superoxide dismutase
MIAFVVAALAFASLLTAQHNPHHAGPTKALSILRPTKDSSARGLVTFTQEGDKVKVVADVTGLQPNQKHAMHIHEFGDLRSDDGMSAGGHYNPEGHEHGLPDKHARHAGDLGNLTADASGNAHYEITVENISIAGKNAILGRGVVVHAKVDDGGQPTGNAGGRIAVGGIGAMNDAWPAKK